MAKRNDIARGYAESLYGLARLEEVADVLSDQLFDIKKGIAASTDLRNFLDDATIPAAEKKKALGEIISAKVSPLLRNCVDTLIDMNRAELIQEVAETYITFVEEKKNRIIAEVTSVVELTPEEREKLAVELGKATGKNVSVKTVVDDSVLGGLVIRIEDKVIDLSLRKKLNDLRGSLRAGPKLGVD